MGNFTQQITLRNARDVGNAQDGLINERDIRQVTIEAVVDTGASTMVITEDVWQKLGLAIDQQIYANIANGTRQVCRRTEAVAIHWKNRSTQCSALVIPGAKKDGDPQCMIILIGSRDLCRRRP